jgi:hypothetical protein
VNAQDNRFKSRATNEFTQSNRENDYSVRQALHWTVDDTQTDDVGRLEVREVFFILWTGWVACKAGDLCCIKEDRSKSHRSRDVAARIYICNGVNRERLVIGRTVDADRGIAGASGFASSSGVAKVDMGDKFSWLAVCEGRL